MTTYATNATLQEVASRIQGAQSIALTTHTKPDGDAIGSVLALARAAEQLGKTQFTYLMGPIAKNLTAFRGQTPVRLLGEDEIPDHEPDLIIICDTGARSQLESLDQWLTDRLEKTIVLDHHVNGDVLASMRIVDPTAASATLVVFELLQHLNIDISGGLFSIAESLLLGLATDTGWFKFNSADPRAFRAAATLIEAGADKARIHAIIEENDRPERFAVMARALGSMEFVGDGKASIMHLGPDDFTETKAIPGDMVAIVNEPLSIGPVRVSVLLSSTDPEQTKMSFRSKPPIETKDGRVSAVDVNRIAMQFGGGGHIHAAGARIDKPITEAVDIVRAALAAEFS